MIQKLRLRAGFLQGLSHENVIPFQAGGRNSLKLELLHEFVVLAKHRSFTSAARELYQSQPNLSMHINAMEKELGYALFERNSSNVSLTPAGTALLDYAQRILNTYHEALSACAEAACERPSLRMCSVIPSSRYHDALMQLKGHPFVFVDLDLEMSCIKALQKGIADCGICYNYPAIFGASEESRFQGISFTGIGQGKMAVCMMKSHPLAAKAALSRADLNGETAVCFAGSHFDDWQRLIKKLLGEELNIRFHMTPIKSLQNLAFMDLGQMVYICGYESVMLYFSERDDVVIIDRLDGEELLFDEALAYLDKNKAAAELAVALAQELRC
jgi:DNA-binding transcriptional LysR family regulator